MVKITYEQLLKKGRTYDLGTQASLADCKEDCISRCGNSCNYFIYGKGSKAGSCLWEHDAACESEQLEADSYDVYKRKARPCK